MRDTGSGIRPEVLERMFEPFFSTKEVGKGSGMELATVHGIVHEYGGHIAVDTSPGRRPVSHPVPGAGAGQEPGERPARARTSDRAPPQPDAAGSCWWRTRTRRGVHGQAAQDLGLAVTVKTNPVEAYNLVAAIPARFDVVITDQTMPKLTGLELACRVTEVRPELPLILYTGYSENLEQEKSRPLRCAALISKPLDRRS